MFNMIENDNKIISVGVQINTTQERILQRLITTGKVKIKSQAIQYLINLYGIAQG